MQHYPIGRLDLVEGLHLATSDRTRMVRGMGEPATIMVGTVVSWNQNLVSAGKRSSCGNVSRITTAPTRSTILRSKSRTGCSTLDQSANRPKHIKGRRIPIRYASCCRDEINLFTLVRETLDPLVHIMTEGKLPTTLHDTAYTTQHGVAWRI